MLTRADRDRDEIKVLKSRDRRTRDAFANLSTPGMDDHDEAVGVTSGTATVGSYVTVILQKISGVETAGTTATLAADATAAPILALCLGPNAPSSGTAVLVSTSPEGTFAFNS